MDTQYYNIYVAQGLLAGMALLCMVFYIPVAALLIL